MIPSSGLARVKVSRGAVPVSGSPPAKPVPPDDPTELRWAPGLDPGVARAWLAAVRLLRPEQWPKNLFVVTPLFFTPPALSVASVAAAAGGVLCFCLLASAIYIINDCLDREADRIHPTKAKRPLAAGTVSVPVALALLVLLLSGATALVSTVNRIRGM
jgi:decaprenyl-phosphate phosphoribosyltransferase